MSIESRSRQYGKVFDHWQIKEYLGSGSGGKTAVFRLVRSDSNRGVSALKVVNLIEVRGDINNLSEFRRKEYETARDECSRNAEQEVWLMDDLRGNTNIVDYLDHTFVDWSDETGFGRDLLIRMELLKDLRSELQNGRAFSEREVLKIGSDICIALIRCHRKNILHRDIKPENIFRNKDGDYKLGDFGVSRVLDACPGAVASTGIGTYEYWPAEQMTGRYDKRVDIYSLGLVLYELCNQNRLPFAASTYVTGKEVSLRLAGTPLPEPIEASPALSEVILKACAFDPEERYQSADELLRALNRVIRSLQKTAERKTTGIPISDVKKKTEYATVPAEASEAEIPADKYRTMPASADDQKKRTSFSAEPVKRKTYATEPAEKHVPKYVTRTSGTKKKSKIPVIWIAVALLGLCIAVFSAGFLLMNGSDKHIPDEKDTILQSEQVPETTIQSTTSPTETVFETGDYEATATETAIVETVIQTEVTETVPVLDPNKAIEVTVGNFHIAALYEDGTVAVEPLRESVQRQHPSWYVWNASRVGTWHDIVGISASGYHIAGLESDGTVVAVGVNSLGFHQECDVSSWSDIVKIATDTYVTVGLKSDGTVIYASNNEYVISRLGDVSELSNVVDICMANGYLEYLQSDGTWKRHDASGESEIYGVYPDLVSIYGDGWNSIGIMKDGKVVIARSDNLNTSMVSSWEDITAVSATYNHILGLKSDGTACAAGKNQYYQCNVSHWENIVSIATDSWTSFGVTADGAIIVSGSMENYNIIPLVKIKSAYRGVSGEIAHTDSGVNVRVGPGAEYEQVTKLIPGTPVNIYENRIDSKGIEWGRTLFGWVCMDYVELDLS